jgi:hypothetical protein
VAKLWMMTPAAPPWSSKVPQRWSGVSTRIDPPRFAGLVMVR